MTENIDQRQFTGWHMLAVMVTFFGVIIAVNLTMAFFATSSWTGIVVDNVYVASQQFNEKSAEGRAQAALGWQPELEIEDGTLRYRLIDKDGALVPAGTAVAKFTRPTHTADDQEITLSPQPDGAFSAPVELGDGLWIVEIISEAGPNPPYRDRRRLNLRGGALQ